MIFSPYNPCCTGSFYGTGCEADCPEAIAWAAYSKAWAESVCARFGYTVAYAPVGPVDEEVGSPTQMAIFRREVV